MAPAAVTSSSAWAEFATRLSGNQGRRGWEGKRFGEVHEKKKGRGLRGEVTSERGRSVRRDGNGSRFFLGGGPVTDDGR